MNYLSSLEVETWQVSTHCQAHGRHIKQEKRAPNYEEEEKTTKLGDLMKV